MKRKMLKLFNIAMSLGLMFMNIMVVEAQTSSNTFNGALKSVAKQASGNPSFFDDGKLVFWAVMMGVSFISLVVLFIDYCSDKKKETK